MKTVVILFAALLVATVPAYLFLSTTGFDFFGNSAQLAGIIFAAVSFLHAREQTRERRLQKAFARIAIGMMVWALGQLLVMYSEVLLRKTSYGTVSSSFFVIGNLIVLSAVLSMAAGYMQRVSKETSRKYALQSLLLAVLLSIVVFAFIKESSAGMNRSMIQKSLDFLYPFFDVAEIALAILLIRLAHKAGSVNAVKAFSAFCVAFILMEIGDATTINVNFETIIY
jgi:hypothetical protein